MKLIFFQIFPIFRYFPRFARMSLWLEQNKDDTEYGALVE
jgi:hypothetical protein